MKKYLLLIVMLYAVPSVWAQKDSVETYNNSQGFGGPKTIGAQLAEDNQPRFSYRIPIRHTKPWYDFKQRLSESSGIEFGLNYTTVFIRSSEKIADTNDFNAGSGILDVQGGWNFIISTLTSCPGRMIIGIQGWSSPWRGLLLCLENLTGLDSGRFFQFFCSSHSFYIVLLEKSLGYYQP